MFELAAAALWRFLEHMDTLLAIFARIAGFMIILPVLSGASLPVMAKIILSLALSILLFETGTVLPVVYDETMPGYVILIIKELFVGFSLGFVVYMAFSAFLFAGQLMDFQIGLSMASVFDPLTLAQTPITGNLLHLITCAALIRTGGLHELIAAAAASFDTIPPGGAVMGGGLFMSAVGLLGEVVAAGLRIAMPVVASLFVIDVALGILVKTVPQMNVFVVGMPLKMIAGLVILYFIAPSLAFAFHGVYDTARDAVEAVTAGFSP